MKNYDICLCVGNPEFNVWAMQVFPSVSQDWFYPYDHFESSDEEVNNILQGCVVYNDYYEDVM